MFGFPNSCSSFSYSAPSILFSSPSTEISLLWCVNLLTSFRRTSRFSFAIGVFFSALLCWRCRQSEYRKGGYLIVERMRSRMTLTETWKWKLYVEKRDQIYWDLFIFLFYFFILADFIDDIVHNSNLYVLQKGKDTLAVTGQEDIFFGHWFSCSGWNWNCAFIVLKFTPKHWKVFQSIKLNNCSYSP